MKKFHFNINNFSGIFGGMSGEKKNIDSCLNEQISSAMFASHSQGFEEELMKRISLENEFRRQDVKTEKIAKTFLSFAVIAFLLIITGAGFLLSSSGTEGDRRVTGAIEIFTGVIETLSLQLTSIFGLSPGSQGGTVFLVLLLSVILYSFAERFLLRKSEGRGK